MRQALVIEDDDVARGSLCGQLARLGLAEVEQAADGDSALRALRRVDRFDLILADLVLPGSDAMELLRDSAQTQPRAAIILISALDERILRSAAVLSRERGLRIAGALRKPLRPEPLQALIEQVTQASVPAAALRAATLPSADELALALSRRDLGFKLQPKLHAGDGRLHSVELLLRWDERPQGAVEPLDIVRLAERSAQGPALAEYVLAGALRACADWWQSQQQVPVSVNLGGAALRRLDLPDFIDRLLKSTGLPPPMLIVEVAEGPLLDDPRVLEVLTRLRLRQVRVSLDNFGAAQGSWVRLQRLPVTELKIARNFVRCLPDASSTAAIVEHSVKLAQALGLETVAVGVENAAQADCLRAMGCQVLQGHFLAPPMPLPELRGWLQQRGTENAS